jgi:hypothetical protein
VLPLVEPALADVPFEPDTSHALQCTDIVGHRNTDVFPRLQPCLSPAAGPFSSPA